MSSSDNDSQNQEREKGFFSTKDATGGKTWVSVTPAKDPQYEGSKVVSVKTNPDTPKSDHRTWISDGKGNLRDPKDDK